jgi:hypothetical protein
MKHGKKLLTLFILELIFSIVFGVAVFSYRPCALPNTNSIYNYNCSTAPIFPSRQIYIWIFEVLIFLLITTIAVTLISAFESGSPKSKSRKNKPLKVSRKPMSQERLAATILTLVVAAAVLFIVINYILFFAGVEKLPQIY